jgi:uncharacterized repeat protein (TIGR02543 family)
MKSHNMVRRAVLLLAAGLTALFCIACPLPEDPNSYSYTVTFYMNDGTGADLGTRIVEAPATTVNSLPGTPTRPGFLFAGWNTAPGGNGIPFIINTPVTANIAVYAQWGSAHAYTVAFDGNGGTTPANPGTKTVVEPATTVDALPAPPGKNGQVFAGWNIAQDGTGAAFTADTPVKADITVYAQWRLPYSYTVAFNNNGGNTEANPGTKTVVEPATTVDALPAPPKKNGLVFAGWTTAEDGSGTAFNADTPVTTNLIVYAQWVIAYSYTVAFNSNGGNTPANPGAKQVNAPATTVDALPAPPRKTGQVFAGWNIAQDGSGTAFSADTPVTANIAVYAQWRLPYSYTVAFNSNGGTTPANPPSKTVVEPATTIGALPAPPGKAGHVFARWNTAANGTGTAFNADTPVTGNLTVYAQWTIAYAYTVAFNSNGGNTEANPATKQVNAPATTVGALPAPPKKTGQTFNGWNTAANGTGTAFNADTPVTASLTVYAQWSLPSYTVAFNNNGGTTAANPATKQVVPPATTIDALPLPPKKTGYLFGGWHTDTAGIYGTPFTAATTVTGDLAVYAQWQSYSYTVTFDVNGGDAPADPQIRKVSSPATTTGPLSTPVKAGANFAGWNTAPNGPGTPFAANTVVTGNITVYARWVEGPANAGIVLRFEDPGLGAWDSAAVEDNFIVKQNGAPTSKTIALADGWTSLEWRVDGRSLGAGSSITLNADDYNAGGHTLQVAAYRSGVPGGPPWSKTVPFRVVAGAIGLALNKAALSLAPGQGETLLPRFTPANAADQSVTWQLVSVNPAGAATLDLATGLVGAVKAGTATVRAISVDNPSVYAECVITVAASQSIELRFDDPGLGAWDSAELGEPFTLYQDGTALDGEPPSRIVALAGGWTSPEWRVDGKSLGANVSVTLNADDYNAGGHTLQVTAYQGGAPWSRTVPFRVVATVTGLALNKTALALAPGQSETLLPRLNPANAADPSVTWTVVSADPAGAVALNPATGMVTGMNIGTATVRATSNDTATAYAECLVTVGASQAITLRFVDPGLGAWNSEAVGETFAISKSGGSKTITLVGSWDPSPAPDWRVDGRPQGGAHSTVVINAANYAVGGHTLQVTVYQGGKPWSKTVAFTVTN